MDDPGIRPRTPRRSPLLSSRPVVVLAQVLLSRPWHRGGPASLRGFSEKVGSARLRRQHPGPTMQLAASTAIGESQEVPAQYDFNLKTVEVATVFPHSPVNISVKQRLGFSGAAPHHR